MHEHEDQQLLDHQPVTLANLRYTARTGSICSTIQHLSADPYEPALHGKQQCNGLAASSVFQAQLGSLAKQHCQDIT